MCMIIKTTASIERTSDIITVYKILVKTKDGWITPYQKIKVPSNGKLTEDDGELVIKSRYNYDHEKKETYFAYRYVDSHWIHSFTDLENAILCLQAEVGCAGKIFEAYIPRYTYYIKGCGYRIASKSLEINLNKVVYG